MLASALLFRTLFTTCYRALHKDYASLTNGRLENIQIPVLPGNYHGLSYFSEFSKAQIAVHNSY